MSAASLLASLSRQPCQTCSAGQTLDTHDTAYQLQSCAKTAARTVVQAVGEAVGAALLPVAILPAGRDLVVAGEALQRSDVARPGVVLVVCVLRGRVLQTCAASLAGGGRGKSQIGSVTPLANAGRRGPRRWCATSMRPADSGCQGFRELEHAKTTCLHYKVPLFVLQQRVLHSTVVNARALAIKQRLAQPVCSWPERRALWAAARAHAGLQTV